MATPDTDHLKLQQFESVYPPAGHPTLSVLLSSRQPQRTPTSYWTPLSRISKRCRAQWLCSKSGTTSNRSTSSSSSVIARSGSGCVSAFAATLLGPTTAGDLIPPLSNLAHISLSVPLHRPVTHRITMHAANSSTEQGPSESTHHHPRLLPPPSSRQRSRSRPFQSSLRSNRPARSARGAGFGSESGAGGGGERERD